MRISKIILYDESTVPEIQIKTMAKKLEKIFPVEIIVRKNFFKGSDDDIFEKTASTRIFDLKKPFQRYDPSKEEIEMEKENKNVTNDKEMILYDGFEIYKTILEHLPVHENKIEILHIIFTNKATCTFDQNDFRYHARALVGSNPAIISTTGMIEAPAKPKQYYLDLMTSFGDENIKEIKRRYKGEFLEYHDLRLFEIATGYVLQAIMYCQTGEPFCKDVKCRLYNAHWQKDLLYSQIESKKFCKRHQEIINQLG